MQGAVAAVRTFFCMSAHHDIDLSIQAKFDVNLNTAIQAGLFRKREREVIPTVLDILSEKSGKTHTQQYVRVSTDKTVSFSVLLSAADVTYRCDYLYELNQ
jgi:hypothetical protein